MAERVFIRKSFPFSVKNISPKGFLCEEKKRLETFSFSGNLFQKREIRKLPCNGKNTLGTIKKPSRINPQRAKIGFLSIFPFVLQPILG